ncbi:hypothetical protein L1987_58985 [Smallanthus sonchifolius]|uniref:Uncharacterized protein n=1 Tax=Smallanthus sonchifolius TaxID=185202 RepID=A0ACB9D4B3_9ASTR|nr:hypothetical protein L1987_58985 [Smallanthus sonchifolius]
MDFPISHHPSPDSASPNPSEPGGSSGNNQLPPRKRSKSSTPEDDNAINNTGKSKRHQFAIPKDVSEGSASRTITTWKKLHEINLLKSILEYHNEHGTYPFDDSTHMQKFYKGWIERGVYIDEDVFTNKMVELPERFFKNQDKTFVLGANLKAWMPPADVRIYELSSMIWGNIKDDDDDFDDVDDDDDDNDGGSCVDPKD